MKTSEIKVSRMVIEINQYGEIVPKIFNDFMRWGGVGSTMDFNSLIEVVDKLEKYGYVVCIDCEETYLHYPSKAKKTMQKFKNDPKIKGVFRACFTAIKHYYNY